MKIDKQRLKNMMETVPQWLPTIVCALLIMWLTLAPHPLGNVDVPMFEGADKIVHAIMFFGFTLCLLFDTLHVRHAVRLTLPMVSLLVFIGMLCGVGIELLQSATNLGRSFEYVDMIADSFGAIAAGGLWIILDNVYFKL